MEDLLRRVDRFPQDFQSEIKASYQDCQDVRNIESWCRRFDQLTLAVEQGRGTYRQVEDHVFELKVLRYLHQVRPDARIVYEPVGINANGRNIDIEVVDGEQRLLIETKCIHPDDQGADIPEEHIAQNNEVLMDPRSYHGFQAARGHLLDITHQTEGKLANYECPYTSVLALPIGFHLDIESLRDFVAIYRYGRPRLDDPLGPMTMHNLDRPFQGTIDQIWALPFPQDSFEFRRDREPTIMAPLIADDVQMPRSA